MAKKTVITHYWCVIVEHISFASLLIIFSEPLQSSHSYIVKLCIAKNKIKKCLVQQKVESTKCEMDLYFYRANNDT